MANITYWHRNSVCISSFTFDVAFQDFCNQSIKYCILYSTILKFKNRQLMKFCIKYPITRLNSKNLCIIFIPNLIRKRFLLVFHNNWNLFPEWKWISTTKKQVGVSSFILSLQHGLKSRCNSVTTFNNFLSTSYTSLNSHLLA